MTKKNYSKIESKSTNLLTNIDKNDNKSLTNNNGTVISNYKLQAKQFALSLIEKSLQSSFLNKNEKDSLIIEISNALCIESINSNKDKSKSSASSSSASKSNHNTNTNHNNNYSLTKKKSRSISDDHNEVCEVCEAGGDLLCCDTCTLVFHLKCIRPKLSNIPKGKWSCSFCILDGLSEGDSYAAKRAVRCMNRLNRGLDSDNEDDDYLGYSRINHIVDGEISIIKKGPKYILRKTENKKLEELGRFGTLEEALGSYKEHSFTMIAANNNNKSDDKAYTTADHSSSSNNSNTTNDSTNSSNNNKELQLLEQQQVKEEPENDQLWCVHCLDDKQVILCAFCGCKRCFGKFDSHLLILCDYCERETHTYCLLPPIYEVPSEDPWYCISCKEEGIPESEVEEYPTQTCINNNLDLDENSSNNSQDIDIAEKARNKLYSSSQNKKGMKPTSMIASSQSTIQQQRGRGRPKGSNKQRKVLSIDDLPAAIIAANTHHNNSNSTNAMNVSTNNHRVTSKYSNLNNIKPSFVIDKNSTTTTNLNNISLLTTNNTYYPPTELGIPPSNHLPSLQPPPLNLYALEDNSSVNINPSFKSKHRDSILKHGPTGLISALKVISKINDRHWNALELDLLLQFRLWGPMEDLEVACNTLHKQKELLLQKILNINPTFDPEELFKSSSAEMIPDNNTTANDCIEDPITTSSGGCSNPLENIITSNSNSSTIASTTLETIVDNVVVAESSSNTMIDNSTTTTTTTTINNNNNNSNNNNNNSNNSDDMSSNIKPLKRSYNKMNKLIDIASINNKEKIKKNNHISSDVIITNINDDNDSPIVSLSEENQNFDMSATTTTITCNPLITIVSTD